jgi:2,4-dienoyl-CoA reductase-like NADH-dependent reductase (Old Yellow Enzyme family)
LTCSQQGTYPLREGGGLPFTPGLFTPEHVGKWKKVTDAVHSKGGKIIVQLYHLGRANEGAMDIEIVSASDVPLPSKEGEVRKPTPRAMTTEEVEQCVEKFAHGAAYAFEAGFDGVEIHGARKWTARH